MDNSQLDLTDPETRAWAQQNLDTSDPETAKFLGQSAVPAKPVTTNPIANKPNPIKGFDNYVTSPERIQGGENTAKALGGAYLDAAMNGFGGLVARKGFEWSGAVENQLREKIPGKTDEYYKAAAKNLINQSVVQSRQKAAEMAQGPGSNPALGFVSGVLGSADPSWLINPGSGVERTLAAKVVRNAAVHGVINSADDAAYQIADQADGIKTGFDIKRNLENAAFGAAFGGAHAVVSDYVQGLYKARGMDTTPGADPRGTTKPLSGQPLTPEESAQYKQLLHSGSEDDIKTFFRGKNGPQPSWDDVHNWVKYRDSVPEGFAQEEYHPELTQDNKQAVQDHIERQTASWKNRPDINVVNSTDPDLHPSIAKDAQDPAVLGIYGADGRVHIMADRIDSEATLNSVLYHESLGHYGLAQKFGSKLDSTLNTLLTRNVGKFGADVAAWQKANPGAYGGDKIRAAEEVLAKQSEAGQIKPSVMDALTAHVRQFGRRMGMKLSYSDAEVRTILGMAHDAVINGKADARSNGFRGGNRYMYLGDRAFNAESRDKFTAPDGRQRNEIADNKARLNLDNYHDEGPIKLGQILDHPKLYDEYPQLRHYKFAIEDLKGNNAEFDPTTKTIKVDPRTNNKLSGVLHEVQHAIQDIEGHSRGGTPYGSIRQMAPEQLESLRKDGIEKLTEGIKDSEAKIAEWNSATGGNEEWQRRTDYEVKRLQQMKDMLAGLQRSTTAADLLPHIPMRIAEDSYRRLFGEVEARDTQWRMNLDEEGRKEHEPYASQKIDPKDYIFSYKDSDNRFMRREPVTPESVAQEAYDHYDEGYTPRYRSHAEAMAAADKTVLDPDNLRKTKSVGQLDKRLYQYDNAAAALNTRLKELASKVEAGEELTGDEQADALATVANFHYALARLDNDLGEVGRALNAAKTIEFRRNNLLALKAELEKEGSSLSGLTDPDNLNKFLKSFNFLTSTGNPKGAAALAKGVAKPNWEDYLLSYRNNMMLSGLSTHAKAVMDMATQSIVDVETKLMALPLGTLRGIAQDMGMKVKDGVKPAEVAAHIWGLMKSSLEAKTWKDAAEAYRVGFQNNSKTQNTPQVPDVKVGGMTIPTGIINIPSKMIAAQDSFFRSILMNANLRSQGVRMAYEKLGKNAKWDDVQTFASNHALSPTKEMLEEAHNETNQTILMNTNAASSALSKATGYLATQGPTGRAASFAIKAITAFSRIGFNAFNNQIIRRSPLFLLDKQSRLDLAAGGARADIALTRAMVGTALMASYWNGYKAILGDKEDPGNNSAKLQALEAGGYRPNALHENGQYQTGNRLNLSINPADKHNNVAIMIAELHEAMDKGAQDHQVATGLKLAATSLIHEFSNSSFVGDVAPFLDAATSRGTTMGQKFERIGEDQAKTFLPNLTNQAAKIIDPNQHDTRGDFLGSLQANIPGQSQKLKVRHSAYGDPMPTGTDIMGVHNWITPGNHVNEPTDPTEREISRLEGAFKETLVGPVQRSVKVDGQTIKLTNEQFEEYQHLAGINIVHEVKQRMAEPDWQKMSDNDKALEIKQIATDTKKAAREYLYGQ